MSQKLFYYFKEKYKEPYEEFVQEYDMILFENRMHIFFQFMGEHVLTKEYQISSLEGMVHLHLEIEVPLKYDVTGRNRFYSWLDYSGEKNSYLCFTCNDHNELLQLRMNPSHPFVTKMNGGMGTPNLNRVWQILLETSSKES